MHLGHTGLPEGARACTLDPRDQHHYVMGERQYESVNCMADAFHRMGVLGDEEVDPMSEAAIKLEVDFTMKMKTKNTSKTSQVKISNREINEFMIMSTHRWIITVLPISIVKQTAKVASLYRETFQPYEPLVSCTDPEMVLSDIDSNDVTRPEVVLLLNMLLKSPCGINIFVYSEKDDEICQVVKEFSRSPEGLINLLSDASSSDILEYILNEAGCMDSTCCFWCEKNKLATKKLFLCSRCRTVNYCSVECQKRDFKAFHRGECKQLAEGSPKGQLGMLNSRVATLTKYGAQFPTMYMAPIEDGVFRGDSLRVYITNIDLKTLEIDEKTKAFPYGMHIAPRENNGQI